MKFLGEYMAMGLTKIAVVEHSFEESEAGYGSQDTSEAVVARKGDEYVKVSVSEHMKFGFKGKRRFQVTSEDAISKDQYSQLSTGKEIIDTPEAIEKIHKEQEALK